MANSNEKHRPIRSFVLRPGRMTDGQKRALEEGWLRYGLELQRGLIDLQAVFGRQAPTVLEIGFGMGRSLADMAKAATDTNFIGIEVHRPGVGRLLHTMQREDIDNIRVYCDDAVEVLRECIDAGGLDGIQVFFPDPWHKKRHHKRRLIQPDFVTLLASRIKPGGFLHLATDWENYAEQMLEVLSAAPELENTAPDTGYCERPHSRPLTKFEQRGQRLGHGVWDLYFKRRADA